MIGDMWNVGIRCVSYVRIIADYLHVGPSSESLMTEIFHIYLGLHSELGTGHKASFQTSQVPLAN